MSVSPVLSMKSIIDLILAPTCPPVPYTWGYPYVNTYAPYCPPLDANPCLREKLAQVLALLDRFLLSVPVDQKVRVLNTPVLTFVPGQGRTDVTILEAAIIMRWSGLVGALLTKGANPNVSTSGLSLVGQLQEAQPLDAYEGDWYQTQEIITLLLNMGAVVPPGYPGTYGYLARAVRNGYGYPL